VPIQKGVKRVKRENLLSLERRTVSHKAVNSMYQTRQARYLTFISICPEQMR